MRSFAVLLAVAAAAALQQDTFCSIGVTGKANDDKNYTLTMFTKAPVPKYNFRSCSFSVSNDIITSSTCLLLSILPPSRSSHTIPTVPNFAFLVCSQRDRWMYPPFYRPHAHLRYQRLVRDGPGHRLQDDLAVLVPLPVRLHGLGRAVYGLQLQ